MVSTHMRGAVIPTSVHKGFLAPVHKDVVYSSHAFFCLVLEDPTIERNRIL